MGDVGGEREQYTKGQDKYCTVLQTADYRINTY